MKRVFVYLSALVGLGGAVYLAGQGAAQGPAPAAPKGGTKVVVFNASKVLKDYQKFQGFLTVINGKKQQAAGPMAKLRTDILKLQDDLQKEPLQAKKEEIQRQLVGKGREFEDAERKAGADLDAESAQYVRVAYGDIQQCVKAIVEANGYELVLAYPDAVDPKELENPLYFTAKLRSAAAMPYYVAPQADVTQVLVDTLNKYFPAQPAVTPAGATAPAQPPQK